jgi:hypothetical protein
LSPAQFCLPLLFLDLPLIKIQEGGYQDIIMVIREQEFPAEIAELHKLK